MPQSRYPRRHLLGAALASALALPSRAAEVDAVYDAVTARLACKCGSCGNSVSTCKMMGCGYCTRVRPRIREEAEAGKTADQIVQGFVDEMGIVALISPPTTGWGALGWAMPFAALGLGLLVAPIVVMRWRKQHEAELAHEPKELNDGELQRYKAQIERELEARD